MYTCIFKKTGQARRKGWKPNVASLSHSFYLVYSDSNTYTNVLSSGTLYLDGKSPTIPLTNQGLEEASRRWPATNLSTWDCSHHSRPDSGPIHWSLFTSQRSQSHVTNERKTLRYTELATDAQQRGWNAKENPAEVGQRGFVASSTIRSLKDLLDRLCDRQFHQSLEWQEEAASGYGSLLGSKSITMTRSLIPPSPSPSGEPRSTAHYWWWSSKVTYFPHLRDWACGKMRPFLKQKLLVT